jgi:hypothetical protein
MLTHNGTCSFFEVGLLLLERWRTTGEGWLSELSKILLLVLTHMRTYTFTCMHKHTLVNHECNASILSCRCHSRCCLLLKAFVYVYKRTNTCTYTSTHAQTDLHAHNLQVRTHTIHATTQANMRVHYTCNYTQANMQLHTKQATTRYTSNYTQPTCNYTQPTTCNYTLYKQLHGIQATTHKPACSFTLYKQLHGIQATTHSQHATAHSQQHATTHYTSNYTLYKQLHTANNMQLHTSQHATAFAGCSL